jgi:hypothetical protein
MKYKMISPTASRAMRTGSNVGWPRVLNSGLPLMLIDDGNVVKSIEMQGEEMVVLVTDIYQSTTKIGAAGDEWLHVLSIGGLSANGYVAYKHMGQIVCELTVTDQTPPTDPPPVVDDINVTVDRTDGEITVNVDGQDFEKPTP